MDIQPITDYLLQFRYYIEWGASISGITAVYLYGEKSNVAPYFGFLAQIIWLMLNLKSVKNLNVKWMLFMD